MGLDPTLGGFLYISQPSGSLTPERGNRCSFSTQSLPTGGHTTRKARQPDLGMARDVPSGGSRDSDSVIPNWAAVKELWNMWEIHVMMVLSLFLQAFLFFFAGLRRRNSSSILRALLSLAYLSADAVAIFALGHLVVHAEGPRHHLMYFWAPFVLVHLGGQDTITALSKQDNELWRRHLLNLVMQVTVAAYVVIKASWPDRRLRAAMIIMFLNGCFKYVERTLCLHASSPLQLSSSSVSRLHWTLRQLKDAEEYNKENKAHYARNKMSRILDMMSKGSRSFDERDDTITIMSEDAPHSNSHTILIADDISDMLAGFKSRAGRCGAYKCVGACLVHHYQWLHTKASLREFLHDLFWQFMRGTVHWAILSEDLIFVPLMVLYIIFQHVSAPLALVLFMAAEKGDRDHTSRADVTVSYILLGGAIILDACAFFSSLRYLPEGRIKNVVLRVINSIQPAGSRKQWSEELAQYNMIRNACALQSSGTIQRFGKRLALWFGFGTTTHIPITKYHTPIKEVILDNLLCLGATKEWNITTSRGKLALQRWMKSHQIQDSTSAEKTEVEKSITTLDFPISVLIWHVATEMCYDYVEKYTNGMDHIHRDKQVSRELSNYIMYLVFICGVKRTSRSQLVHQRASSEIKHVVSQNINVFRDLFKQKKVGQQHSSTDEIQKPEELNMEGQESIVKTIQEPAEQAYKNLLELVQSEKIREGVDPVLPQAYKVARELLDIEDAAERWRLIVEVWLEMLYYVAPVCGSAFHYEHLTTGGELVTHVLVLMQLLGPFLPDPTVSTPQNAAVV